MAEGAKGTVTDVYVLGTGDAAAERLRLLDQVYGPFTRRLLHEAGLGEGQRVLDLACGIGAVACSIASEVGATGSVVAADVNPDQLAVAKSRCAKCEHLPIEYVDASAYATGFPDESFDLVHVRLLLCHLTEPRKVLRELYRLLKPGGALVCQDLNVSGFFSHPAFPVMVRSIEVAKEAEVVLGVNYDYGLSLPADAVDAGFRSVETRMDHPVSLRGPEKRLWELTFREAIPTFLRCEVATESELNVIADEMQQIAEDERVLIGQWGLPAVIARK